jgi:hypothetical protein
MQFLNARSKSFFILRRIAPDKAFTACVARACEIGLCVHLLERPSPTCADSAPFIGNTFVILRRVACEQ